MTASAGNFISQLDTPHLLINLDMLDANLARMQGECRKRGVDLRVHFKSLKCGGLAKYLVARGVTSFLCAKLNEAEVLADAGITDIFVANEIVGPMKLDRLAALAQRITVRVCVDDADNIADLGRAARKRRATIGVLVEVDIGLNRCGVEPGAAALELARRIAAEPGLQFLGLQGYDGHLQMVADEAEQEKRCLEGLGKLIETRQQIERAGLPVAVATGCGTGTWRYIRGREDMTEIQPGSFLLMDCAYHAVRPEFGYALSVLAAVVSRRPGWYVLDAGSKAVSQDFGKPVIKGRPEEKVVRLSEEHTKVECDAEKLPALGEHREVVPSHCCATMNLHRQALAVRGEQVESMWLIESSGRYD
jgi:D-serine deaminase-like pyridoxal phosphate-dependent protein